MRWDDMSIPRAGTQNKRAVAGRIDRASAHTIPATARVSRIAAQKLR